MLSLVLAAVLQGPVLTRDAFGVPIIEAANEEAAFELQGYAAAQDRMWQMETSRRVSRGRMAEVFGKAYRDSDREVIRMGYSPAEIQAQLNALSARTRTAITAYSKGVNRLLDEAKRTSKLPPGYSQNGFQPEPWTELDTAAIFIQLARRFGQGGAGELRNLALLKYLQGQPGSKARALDVLDDLAWQNDFRSPTTVAPPDDPIKVRPEFPNPTRDITEAHLKRLPTIGLMEILPAIRLAQRETSTLLAESVAAPFKVGSYAVVVSGKRSATGWPILLSAPQMGHTTPSVIHEVSLRCPTLEATGMDVPGIPGVVIGSTPSMAWGLTSGVADTDDVLYYESKKPGTYRMGTKELPVLATPAEIPIKGEATEKLTVERTAEGPILLKTAGGAIFASRMGYWGREMAGLDAVIGMSSSTTPDQIEAAMDRNPLSFNVFYATKTDIGYLYAGDVPLRPMTIDPRFPIPASPEVLNLGMVRRAQMPRARNPQSGLLANWNNKPVAWWPNLDTPVWGRIFRNQILLEALTKPKLSVADVELAAWHIARRNENFAAFRKYVPGPESWTPEAKPYQEVLSSFDGWNLAGQIGPALFDAWINALRTELFAPVTGSFLNESTFRTAVQPSLMLSALEGKTKVNYLGTRSREEVARAALERARASLAKSRGADLADWGYVPGALNYPGEPPVPYGNRGTYIQIVEMGPVRRGRNISSPGIAESGPHSRDQVPLARAWTFKPMALGGNK